MMVREFVDEDTEERERTRFFYEGNEELHKRERERERDLQVHVCSHQIFSQNASFLGSLIFSLSLSKVRLLLLNECLL
jgi:hypothetical protein